MVSNAEGVGFGESPLDIAALLGVCYFALKRAIFQKVARLLVEVRVVTPAPSFA